jgi:hypothetical protein
MGVALAIKILEPHDLDVQAGLKFVAGTES